MCGTLRRSEHHSSDSKLVIDTNPLEFRWQELETTLASSKYNRKKNALEQEFVSFLNHLSPPKSLDSASLREIIYFLIWKDKDSKTQVHRDTCQNQGTSSKTPSSCGCPQHLAFKSVDSYIGQLRAILRDHLETTTLPTTGDPAPNPTAHPTVKPYSKVKCNYLIICQTIKISVSTGPLFRATCGQSIHQSIIWQQPVYPTKLFTASAVGVWLPWLLLVARWMTLLIMLLAFA